MKKLIKIISLIIALFLVFSLVSCGNPKRKDTNPDKIKDFTGKLTDEMKSEIQLAYYNENKDLCSSPKQIRGTCYGVFDDASCLILTLPDVGSLTLMTYIEVAGYTFAFGDNNTMVVYCDGEFYGLKQTYENGILDDNELAELYADYNKFHWGR